jgi:hypothetical protein
MAYEQKDGSGSLFPNTKKEQDTHADYKGDVKIDGVGYWINGWKKKDKNGNPYLSLSIKPKQPKPAPQDDGRGMDF